MIITGSFVEMSSRRTYQEQSSFEQRLEAWADPRSNSNLSTIPLFQDTVELSAPALESTTAEAVGEEEALLRLSPEDELKLTMVQMLLEKLTGKKFRFRLPPELKLRQNSEINPADLSAARQNSAPRAGWGLRYDSRSYYHEAEKTSVQARGVVKTADGQEIHISLKLSMSREFSIRNEVHLQAGDAKAVDPLVINYQGAAATLTQRSYAFDLNSDGIEEQVSFTGPGSGFLALDKNGDGIINNGLELFGTESGDGFADLAEYDMDGNGWIDEGDTVFTQLKIWSKDEDGQDRLISVHDAGVGAIFLGNVQSQFSLTDNANQDLGYIRQTGLFLREDGSAGTVQHIDLVV